MVTIPSHATVHGHATNRPSVVDEERRLVERILCRQVALVVIARKLLRIAFAVWKSGMPFDANLVGQKAPTAAKIA